MSREEYQMPSTGGGDQGGANRSYAVPQPIVPMTYICGDCGLKSTEHMTKPFLRCNACGCRILYKERTKR
jgi:DNA-directed RNA polymerase I, II, and III subunit RPABC4